MDLTTSTTAPEQLALLAPPPLPVQFLLDQHTRQRGMAHVAAIKAQLAARACAQQSVDTAAAPGERKAA
jgi:hypothetical protein